METDKDDHKVIQGPNGQRILVRVVPPVHQPRQIHPRQTTPLQHRQTRPVPNNAVHFQPRVPIPVRRQEPLRAGLRPLQPVQVPLGHHQPIHVRLLPPGNQLQAQNRPNTGVNICQKNKNLCLEKSKVFPKTLYKTNRNFPLKG